MKSKTLIIFISLIALTSPPTHAQWKQHTIDNSSRGADGVRLADVNNDNRLDITTGWEEGAQIRVYLNPGPQHVTKPWPRVTVGQVKSPEDAVFVDLDNDGAVDVVSSCEGRTKKIYVHWAPKQKNQYLNPSAWQTQSFPATHGRMWMFTLPMQLDQQHGTDLIIGAKDGNAQLAWLQSPKNPRNVHEWRYHTIAPVGWIMSIQPIRLSNHKTSSFIVSDRKTSHRGIYLYTPLVRNNIEPNFLLKSFPGMKDEIMFLAHGQLTPNTTDILAATWNSHLIHHFKPNNNPNAEWQSTTIPQPYNIKHGKAVAIGDINLDDKPDIVFTAAKQNLPKNKQRTLPGVCVMLRKNNSWQTAPIADPKRGLKFDRIELIDLDADGDLDVLTCEEADNLGVIWYENPTRQLKPAE